MQITPRLYKNLKLKQNVCKTFSKRLKKLRESRNLTLEDIADKLGISRQSVVYYAMGDRVPNIVILIQLAELLDTSIDYLVGTSNAHLRYYSNM